MGLPGERDNARNNVRCTQSRKSTYGMTEDRDKWRQYVHVVANPRIEDGYRTELGDG